jgi:hypothetical protein
MADDLRAVGPYNMIGDPMLERGVALPRQPGLDWSDPRRPDPPGYEPAGRQAPARPHVAGATPLTVDLPQRPVDLDHAGLTNRRAISATARQQRVVGVEEGHRVAG